VMRCGIPGDAVDLAIAMEHLALAATAEGLGTCWIGAFDQDQVREVLGIPESAKVVELMTLGYPAGSQRSRACKPLSEIVCYDRWQ
jgi:nitroreductase